MIQDMDQWLGAYAELAKERFPKADPKYPGTGAAGGMGFAFLTFTDAVLESGINIVLDETKLEDYIKDADLVITGEGRMDGQTAMGKAPVGVISAFVSLTLAITSFFNREYPASECVSVNPYSSPSIPLITSFPSEDGLN